jgi:MFS family permease
MQSRALNQKVLNTLSFRNLRPKHFSKIPLKFLLVDTLKCLKLSNMNPTNDENGEEQRQCHLTFGDRQDHKLSDPQNTSTTNSALWDDRGRTTFCVNASAIIERVDEQLLPSLYRFVGASFHARPSELGNLTLARALAQAIASPIAGILGQHFNRITVLCCGAAIWGTTTLAFSRTTSIAGGLVFWAFNGIGLSFLIPSAQSLTADYNQVAHRGRAFGQLHFVGAFGALIGGLFATNIGHVQHVFGIMEGWRFAFFTVAIASWAIGLLTWHLAVDPRYSTDPRYKVDSTNEAEPEAATWRASLRDMGSVVTIPTFGIIVLQGIVGSTPWTALVFLTLYFQLIGMSDLMASLLMAIFLAANACGGLLGGLVGDWAARKFPDHGRIVACQFSVGIGVPLSIVLFKALPLSSSAGAVVGYALVLSITGLLITWAATACNNPIFAEIVPSHMRHLIYAFDRSFEGAIAAAGAPLVGILAEKGFGFHGDAAIGADPVENEKKARSLGSALLLFTALPWLFCAIFFSGLHWTYPRDREKARKLAAEMHAAAERDAEERQRLRVEQELVPFF